MAGAADDKERSNSAAGGGTGGRVEEKKALVRDLSSRGPFDEGPKGFVNAQVVRACLFYLILVSLATGVAVCVLGIWDYLPIDIVAKMFETLGVVVLGSLLFWLANEALGR